MKILCSTAVLLTAFLLMFAGCESGPEKVTISGTVSYDGKPLDDATLELDSSNGSLPELIEISNGKFTGKVTLGKKTLRFTAMRTRPEQTAREIAIQGMKSSHYNILPETYGFDSTMKLDVTAEGHSNLEYELSSK